MWLVVGGCIVQGEFESFGGRKELVAIASLFLI